MMASVSRGVRHVRPQGNHGYQSAPCWRGWLANQLRLALAPHGLHPAQFTALAEIARTRRADAGGTGHRLDLEQPGVARTLAGLEAEGWIERRARQGPGAGPVPHREGPRRAAAAANAVAAADRGRSPALSRTEAAPPARRTRSTWAERQPLNARPAPLALLKTLSPYTAAFSTGRPAERHAVAVLNAGSRAASYRTSKMPKMKTKSGAKKRFKMTATGRVKAGVAGKRHRLLQPRRRLHPLSPGHQDPQEGR
jgi:hypothetical protein